MNRRDVLQICASAAMLVLASAVYAVPANDTCANAIQVFDGDTAIDNTGATQDTVIDCFPPQWLIDYGADVLSGQDVWYSYTAPSTGVRNFEIHGPNNGVDATIAIYAACGGTALACDYNGGPQYNAKIYHFPVTAGTTYKIRYSVFVDGGSPATLTISEPPTPQVLDDCELAAPFAGEGDFAFDTSTLTDSDVQAWDCDLFHDGWIAWTPSISGRAVISACDAVGASNLQFAFYGACGEVPLVACRSNNFFDPPNAFCSPKFAQNVLAGHTYYLRFGTFPASVASGNIHFEVRPLSTAFQIPAGAIAESEACDATFATDPNGGCTTESQTVASAQLCQTYTGTISARRLPLDIIEDPVVLSPDNDWYEFTLAADDTVTITGQSEFLPGFSGDFPGGIYVDSCPGVLIKALPNPMGKTVDGVYDLTFSKALPAGTYYLVISPLTGGGSGTTGDCTLGSNRYWFKITGSTPCPTTGACCTGTSCNITTAAACTGSYQGDNVTCTATSCCPADFDHSGAVNVSDIFAFLRAWFSHSTTADIDANNAVNVSDIFAFLRHWFAHC